jgi:hypothetical protein
MLERSEVPIGELLPLLPNGPSVGIPVHQLSVRARNVLNRHGLSSWRALRSFTPGGLLQLPNVGMSTAREILAFALRFAGGTATPSEMWTLFELGQVEPMGDSHETSPQLAPRLSRIASELALLASWAVRERSVTEISELLSLPDSLQVPTTLRGSWAELRADLRDLADDELVQPTLGDLYKRLLDQLAESRRLVLEHRLLADSPMTLDELGTIRGVTREAVRQDEKRLKTQLATLLDNRTYLPFRWRAEDLANRLGVMAPTSADITVEAVEQALRDVPDDVKATVLNLLLRFAMPASYTVKNGWYIRGGPDRLPTSEMFWAHYAPASAVSLEDCREWLSEHSVEPRFLFEWVETVSGLRIEGDFVLRWENNVVDKCIAILEMTGKAATVDDLVERIGQGNNPRGVRDRLFQDPRVIRVDKYRFALREWGLEEYTGIAEEMAQRIAQAGGEADLNSIVKELVTTFGVAAGSVRAYADAPMFIRSGSRVRMRDSHESIPDSADLSACRGVFRLPGGRFSYVLDVDREVLRGSGRSFPKALAITLHVTPENPRTFHAKGQDIKITWPKSSHLGPSLGSTRAIVEDVGARIGDKLLLVFDRARGTFEYRMIEKLSSPAIELAGAIEHLTGVVIDHLDINVAVAEAIAADVGSVRAALRTRGDVELAELLPEQAPDASLSLALDELATVIDSLE